MQSHLHNVPQTIARRRSEIVLDELSGKIIESLRVSTGTEGDLRVGSRVVMWGHRNTVVHWATRVSQSEVIRRYHRV